MGAVYIWKDKRNEMVYVGKSTDYKKRLDGHKAGKQFVDKVLHKYGLDNFDVIIEEDIPDEFLNLIEIGMIQSYQSVYPNGYNFTLGGDGQIPSEETRKKLSDAKKGKPSGKLGCLLTEETKEKIRIARAKQIITEEHKKKTSASLRGRKHPWNINNPRDSLGRFIKR